MSRGHRRSRCKPLTCAGARWSSENSGSARDEVYVASDLPVTETPHRSFLDGPLEYPGHKKKTEVGSVYLDLQKRHARQRTFTSEDRDVRTSSSSREEHIRSGVPLTLRDRRKTYPLCCVIETPWRDGSTDRMGNRTRETQT